ncbi:HAD family phosphatase [Roseomonas terrae]|jgi:HAD superfamily hydrolase (TIGR01509 family)|uniref:HAD family phosphatase n=2 Tax=Neoroseomonas terrae TaxID=424799 RepID=A0ABS5EHY1_9PROT|nr:HAD family phosphatase [Neoroseomonas terrae]MBR0650640.1 HAD family phosphatase [Neoroseomonas terrae]
MPGAVVFDMDGLLFDTEVLHRAAAQDAAAEHGCVLPDAVFLSLIGGSAVDNRARLLAHFGTGFGIDDFEACWSRHYAAHAAGGPALKRGVAELLTLLDALGLRRAIATSSSHEAVRRNLAAHGLAGRFDAVVARGDYARGKPAPDPFLRAAEQLGVAPGTCLALEDSPHGVRAAAAAGMTVVMVPDLVPACDADRRLCATVAEDLHAVVQLIAGCG